MPPTAQKIATHGKRIFGLVHARITPFSARAQHRASTFNKRQQGAQQVSRPGTDVNDLHRLLKASYAKDTSNVGDYVADHELSSPNTRVYLHRQTKKPYIVHRGSKTLGDWAQNGLIAAGLGRLAPRVRNARKITEQTEAKYGAPASAFGHSLGGYLAENSGASGEVQTYNKYVPGGDIRKQLKPNQTDYHTSHDVVSALARTQHGANRVLIDGGKSKGIRGAHSVDRLVEFARARAR